MDPMTSGHTNRFDETDAFDTLLQSEVCSLQFGVEAAPQAQEPTRLGRVQAGSIDVFKYTGEGTQWGNRRPDHIRTDWADYYLLCVPLTATLAVRQSGIETILQPEQFAFLDTSKPFWGRIRPLDESMIFSALHARVPGTLLRQRLPTAANICNRVGEIRAGSSNLMRILLDAALSDAPHLSAQQNLRLGDMLFDSICEAAIQLADDSVPLDTEEPRKKAADTYERACRFIASHLSDPALDTRQIAEHCGVSVRYLQSAFAWSSTTVGQFIRESRLQACRTALQDPSLRSRPIIEIANQWGFQDQSHFSHAYKARFGKTPREERPNGQA
jgi:AraC-like DNA-binding protein